MYCPSSSNFANNLFQQSGADRRDWHEAQMAGEWDKEGLYRVDAGFKNNPKVRDANGDQASKATITVQAAGSNKIVAQIHAQGTRVDDMVPTIRELNKRHIQNGDPEVCYPLTWLLLGCCTLSWESRTTC
jgi:hypothetical protein